MWQGIEIELEGVVRELELNSEENNFRHSLGFQLNFFGGLSHIGSLTVTPADGKCRRISGPSVFSSLTQFWRGTNVNLYLLI